MSLSAGHQESQGIPPQPLGLRRTGSRAQGAAPGAAPVPPGLSTAASGPLTTEGGPPSPQPPGPLGAARTRGGHVTRHTPLPEPQGAGDPGRQPRTQTPAGASHSRSLSRMLFCKGALCPSPPLAPISGGGPRLKLAPHSSHHLSSPFPAIIPSAFAPFTKVCAVPC